MRGQDVRTQWVPTVVVSERSERADLVLAQRVFPGCFSTASLMTLVPLVSLVSGVANCGASGVSSVLMSLVSGAQCLGCPWCL